MSTNLQKNLAQNIVKNIKRKKPLNKKELLVTSGYALESATSVPGKIIEQKGVQEELKSLGFSEEKAKQVVAKILENEYEDSNVRLNAAKEVFKVFGTYAAEKSFNLTATTDIETLKSAIQGDIQRFRLSDGK